MRLSVFLLCLCTADWWVIVFADRASEQAAQLGGLQPVQHGTVPSPLEATRVVRSLRLNLKCGCQAVYADDGNSSSNVAHVGQAGLGLPDRSYYLVNQATDKVANSNQTQTQSIPF